MLSSLLSGAVRFRLVLLAVAAGVTVLGALSLPRMHSDVLLEFRPGPVLEVQTEALGLSSQEVEQYVTVPLENNLLDGIMNVWDVRSRSLPGLSTVDLYFEPGTTTLHARQLVEERLTNAFSLPNVSKPPQLIQPLSSSSRALLIGLGSKSLDPLELSYLARWVVKPRLSGVPGVANVAIFGQRDRQMQVLVDPGRLAAHHLTLSQIIETAGNAQLVSPLSYLQGSAPGTGGFLDGPNQRLEIRPLLPLGAPRNLATVPVSGAATRTPLGAVATVVQGHQPLVGDAIVGGGSGLVLVVQKLPAASVVAVTNGLDRALADLRPALTGVQLDASFFRPASYVSASLDHLGLALAIAGALALVALGALFLGNRSLLIGASAVALSLLMTMLLLQALGYTCNALIILGLLLAGAVVVDEAIEAAHAIARGVHEREAPSAPQPIRALVIAACAELQGTLAYATAIALLVVAPALFAKGLSATFVHPMLVAFALAVIVSMVVALTFTPALAVLLFERWRPRPRATPAAARIGAVYEQLLRRAFGIPRGALAAVCLAGLAGVIVLPFLREPAPPTFRDRSLVVQWDGPAGASLAEMDRITRRIVGELRALPAVSDAAATLGRAVSADQIVDASSGQIFVALTASAGYDRAVAEVRSIVEGTPGLHASLGTYERDVMSGVLAPPAHTVVVRVYGQDYGRLRLLGSQVRALMSQVRGLAAPRLRLPTEEPNIEVAVNDAAALRAGVLPGDARRQASTLVSGLTVGNFFENQAVFDVIVRGTPSVRSRLDAARNLLIDTSGGGHVRLGDIAQVRVRSDPVGIQHQALSRYVDVSAPVSGGDLAAARAALARKLHRVSFPLTYHAEVLGGTPDDPTSHVAFLSYVLAAAVGVLLLLQAAFGSWRLAALLFLLLPLALTGGLLVALATGQIRSLGTDAGLLAAFAFAARQGMLQLAHIRRTQALHGGALTPAIVVRAARERLAPSLGAAAVTAVALLPFLLIGDVAGNETSHIAAAVILGGLVSATVLTQVLLPALCLALGPTRAPAIDEPAEEIADAPSAQASSSTTP